MIYNVKRYNDKHVFTTKDGVLMQNGEATDIAANDDNLVEVVRSNAQKLMPVCAIEVSPEMRKLLDFMHTKYPLLVEEHQLNAKTPTKIWYKLAHKSKPIARKCLGVVNFSKQNENALRARTDTKSSTLMH